MNKLLTIAAAGLSSIIMLGSTTAMSAENYYEDKTVKIIVGAGMSGGTGMYAHLVKNFLGKHIPGNPSVIVQGKPGGGGVKLGNLLKAGKIDSTKGTVIALFHGSWTIPGSAIPQSKKVKFGPSDFVAVGSLLNEPTIIAIRSSMGIKTLDELRNEVVKFAASGFGASTNLVPQFLNSTFDTKTKTVLGYRGSGKMLVSIVKGETDAAAISLSTLEKKKSLIAMTYLAAIGDKNTIPAGVPDILDLVKDEDAKILWQFFADSGTFGRTFVVYKSTPLKQQKILTKAFDDMIKDRRFISFTKKRKFPLNPVSAESTNDKLKSLANLDPKIKSTLRSLMKKK